MSELNYAAILRAGQGLVPDLRQQLMQEREDRYVTEQRDLQMQALRTKQQRTDAFRVAVQGAVDDGSPESLRRIMVEFPEFAEQIKPAWDSLTKEARQRNLTQTGTVYARAQAGDFKGAADALEERYNADVAAGTADKDSKAIIDAYRSGDPERIRVATATLGMILAASDPDKFAETTKALNPVEAKTTDQRGYEWRKAMYGQAAADKWLAVQDTKLVPVQPGGTIFNAADLAGAGGGGLVATSEQEAETARLEAMFPNAPRYGADSPKGGDQSDPRAGVPAPAVNAEGVPPVLTQDQYAATVASMGKQQTDDWMTRNGIKLAGGTTQRAGQVPRVRSKQEYDRLPAGAQYVAPDGSLRRKN